MTTTTTGTTTATARRRRAAGALVALLATSALAASCSDDDESSPSDATSPSATTSQGEQGGDTTVSSAPTETSGGAGPDVTATTRDSAATDPTGGTEPTGTSAPVLTLPDLEDPTGIANDVVIEDCELRKGAVQARGTAVNSGEGRADLAITIIWMLNNSDDPISLASTTLDDVGAGDEVEWSVETEIDRAAERCVINARRGDA